MLELNGEYYCLPEDRQTYIETPLDFEEESSSDFINRIKKYSNITEVFQYQKRNYWQSIPISQLFSILSENHHTETGYFETPWSKVFLCSNGVFVYYECGDIYGYDVESYLIYYDSYQEFVESSTNPNLFKKLCKSEKELNSFLFGERSEP